MGDEQNYKENDKEFMFGWQAGAFFIILIVGGQMPLLSYHYIECRVD